MNRRNIKYLILFIFTLNLPVTAENYYIGPSRDYQSPADVRNLLNPGDTVFVEGDTVYAGDINFSRPGSADQRIVIRGLRINGRRPVIDGGTNTVAFINGADHYTFEGFEIRNASFRGIYHQSDDLILRDLIIHHCNNGIMGADGGSGDLLLEYTEIYQCGEGDRAHQIYMATNEEDHPGSVFRMQFCYIHDGAGGNNVKSRAERNEIYYNWIEGAYYHELELIGPDPDGGVPADLEREDSDVVGNVLISGGYYVTRIGGDATGESNGRYRFVNNTIIMYDNAVFRIFDGIQSVEMHNNIIISEADGNNPILRQVEAEWEYGEQISGSNNYIESGLTNVPEDWTGTLRGPENVFTDLVNRNLYPAEGGPVINQGNGLPSSAQDFEFIDPLFPPAFFPPEQYLMEPGTALPRVAVGTIDIGAFEVGSTSAVKTPENILAEYQLHQNYPNPFNPVTVISWQLPVSSNVNLSIYTILGIKAATLVNEKLPAGNYKADWNASGFASGVYLYRLETSSGFTRTRKMILMH